MNKISVVLMVYNRKEYYREALDSLKEQTDKDFDVVIVSNIEIEYDLSTFRNVLIIPAPVDIHEEYIDGKAPSNLLESYIYGLHVCSGEVAAFMDDDDRFIPEKVAYLKQKNIEGYYHNDYFDFGSQEPHNNGRGFNASCIAVNKSAYKEILAFVEEHPLLGYMPDSAIYWYALEHNLPVLIDDTKLTYYRHKPLKKMYSNLLDSLNSRMSALGEAEKAFKSDEVKDIIREGKIQNQLYLNTLGHYRHIPITDMLWLMKRPVISKGKKLMSYFLSFPVWRGIGLKLMANFRATKEVEK
ncbi:MAG: glycosyltransferase [Ferroplasma sp.]|uniref:glycosyltransferase family 2 protein n=1 Tax=Ferroplasma sp. TaxID=2591003 RepID=UPI0028160BF4|nr:glycosyltransferase [Ferroplasma sp.]WMT51864.1 MAG: glycosyltransferase [Ferroplasma sp.]